METLETEWILDRTSYVLTPLIFPLNYTLPMLKHTLSLLDSQCAEGWLYSLFFKWSEVLENREIIPKDSFRLILHNMFCLEKMEFEQKLEFVFPAGLPKLPQILTPDVHNLNYTLEELSDVLSDIQSHCAEGWMYLFFSEWTQKLIKRGFLQEGDFSNLSDYFCLDKMEYDQILSIVFKTNTLTQAQMIAINSEQIIAQNNTMNSKDQKIDSLDRKIEEMNQTIISQNNQLLQALSDLNNSIQINHESLSNKLRSIEVGLWGIPLYGVNFYILTNRTMSNQLKLFLSSENITYAKLLLRASRDGWSGSDFHRYCDKKGSTLIIGKSTTGHGLGGYTNINWDSHSSGGYRSKNGRSFLFSLTHNTKHPNTDSRFEIYCRSDVGPRFGGGRDLHISYNANTNTKSNSNLGHNYQPPAGSSKGSNTARSHLAGSYKFQLVDYEVYLMQ